MERAEQLCRGYQQGTLEGFDVKLYELMVWQARLLF